MKNFIVVRTLLDRDRAAEAVMKTVPSNPPFCVEIKEYRETRRAAQNRLLWAWYQCFAKETGYSKSEVHDKLGGRFLDLVEVDAFRDGEKIKIIRPVSTAGITVSEFSEYLKKIEILAIDLDIKLPFFGEETYFTATKV